MCINSDVALKIDLNLILDSLMNFLPVSFLQNHLITYLQKSALPLLTWVLPSIEKLNNVMVHVVLNSSWNKFLASILTRCWLHYRILHQSLKNYPTGPALNNFWHAKYIFEEIENCRNHQISIIFWKNYRNLKV